MANAIEVRERQKHLLGVLLKLKKLNVNKDIDGLQQEIIDAVNVMDKEDVAWVEKNYGVSAF